MTVSPRGTRAWTSSISQNQRIHSCRGGCHHAGGSEEKGALQGLNLQQVALMSGAASRTATTREGTTHMTRTCAPMPGHCSVALCLRNCGVIVLLRFRPRCVLFVKQNLPRVEEEEGQTCHKSAERKCSYEEFGEIRRIGKKVGEPMDEGDRERFSIRQKCGIHRLREAELLGQLRSTSRALDKVTGLVAPMRT